MSKQEYLAHLQAVYRIANLSDSDSPKRADWLDADAAGHQCRPIDKMIQALEDKGLISQDERRAFYDNL